MGIACLDPDIFAKSSIFTIHAADYPGVKEGETLMITISTDYTSNRRHKGGRKKSRK